ncbi:MULTISPECIES: lysoplasmalogenase family protein [Tatumella]|uniref:Lysoplasmalogenase n=1 Tax=Tatumella punctata TaxID=399969 RepID=A0ABW1VPE1_9GAMM|nr:MULTISPECIES: lysoplasmalogenase family protein [unclassified Tatumella]MBS0855656.1 lysoplasmalogenase [Tatumella sp. JGM16]MBS0876637.1 lysoplasmalogenase [Tatumella sp. JGM82]MBS0889976.1 lysoplasmalogenase [Tatumella sp. JGM94]MBS0893162.1 lysoplasmalogenase [Tatumella sp. JGM130]MBS0901220.1 lysoplasmalogenase [Tatumella sp. JGM100]
MLWSFLAVLFSGWLYIDASYRGPRWQRWLFKPVTFLLMLAWAWQAPVRSVTDYLLIGGLVAAMAGGVLSLLSRPQLVYAFGTMFLSYLLYTLSLTRGITLTIYWPVPVALLVAGLLVLMTIRKQLDELCWPVCTMLTMVLVMCWLAILQYVSLQTDQTLSLMAGAILLLLANFCWLISFFRHRFPADRAIYEALFILGHFMIIRSLWLS